MSDDPTLLPSLENIYSKDIVALDDCVRYSELAKPAIDIVRKHMVDDSGHDEAHLTRVVRNAIWFARSSAKGEKVDHDILVPAAILHDLVNLPKDSPDRASASRMSANLAVKLLMEQGVDDTFMRLTEIHHVIHAHSWSANITPTTLEAKAVQDADRIDSLGMLGIVRLFSVGGSMGRKLFHPTEPIPITREIDELTYTLDHFYTKLIKLQKQMQTSAGKLVAEYKTRQMLGFIETLVKETGLDYVHTS